VENRNGGEFNRLRNKKGYRDEAGFIQKVLAVSGLLCIQIAKDEAMGYGICHNPSLLLVDAIPH
jgi:hypothetical protein